MIDLHANAPENDVEKLSQRACGTEILQNHAGVWLDHDEAAITK
jgi:hypothetical protein